MVKKLRCTVENKDYIKACERGYGDVRLHVKVDGNKHDIFLTPSDAKKLRKQIKKALIEIEGEPEEEIPAEKEEPAYIPHVGEVVEVYRNTEGHCFQVGERVRIQENDAVGDFVAEYLDKRDFWFVKNDIRPIPNWKPKKGEKVLIVDSTSVPTSTTLSWIGKFGYIRFEEGDGEYTVYNEDKSDWFVFNFSDLRPAE